MTQGQHTHACHTRCLTICARTRIHPGCESHHTKHHHVAGEAGYTNQRFQAQYGFVPLGGNPADRLVFDVPSDDGAGASSGGSAGLLLERAQDILGDSLFVGALSGKQPRLAAALRSLPWATEADEKLTRLEQLQALVAVSATGSASAGVGVGASSGSAIAKEETNAGARDAAGDGNLVTQPAASTQGGSGAADLQLAKHLLQQCEEQLTGANWCDSMQALGCCCASAVL
jgi:hypothetical protein